MKNTENATVFVIDDDASVRRGLRRILRSAGHVVEEFASALDFLRRERSSGTGCLVLDIRMPQMTGAELFDRMVALGDSLPVIFLTGHGDVRTSVHAMKGGAVDFLLKPVDSETLLGAIQVAFSRHSARRTREESSHEVHARLRTLSPREREVMEHVVRGEPNKRIAADLGISEKTVKVHRHWDMVKMKASSLPELVRMADSASTPVSLD
jgi:FixJ family two-component response regulator